MLVKGPPNTRECGKLTLGCVCQPGTRLLNGLKPFHHCQRSACCAMGCSAAGGGGRMFRLILCRLDWIWVCQSHVSGCMTHLKGFSYACAQRCGQPAELPSRARELQGEGWCVGVSLLCLTFQRVQEPHDDRLLDIFFHVSTRSGQQACCTLRLHGQCKSQRQCVTDPPPPYAGRFTVNCAGLSAGWMPCECGWMPV